ncbi:MAG TPA: thiosulfohydrolase SoxB, partial [Burkholderiales bacterium]|nr:thiosulfohydrolase SoxB [Burkholderiales bacterium]
MRRREFIRLLALAAAAGGTLRAGLSQAQAAAELYDLPAFGNLSLLHVTDVHAQLLPVHFREPSVNLATGQNAGKPPHLVGEAFLKHFSIQKQTPLAHAFTYLDFAAAARRYGKLGGYAHLATLV